MRNPITAQKLSSIVNVRPHSLGLSPVSGLSARPAPCESNGYTGRAMIRTFRPIPLKKIKLVIFDLDGTLIDSELDLAAAVNAMLRHYGRKELPLQVIGTYIGDGAPMLIRRALGDPADREFLQEALNYFLPIIASTSSTTPALTKESSRRCSRLPAATDEPQAGGAHQQAGAGVARHPGRTGTGGQLLPGLRRQQLRDQEA